MLGAWMAKRGLLWTGDRITPATFESALRLRTDIRGYLQCDPTERRADNNAVRSLNSALRLFPLVPEARTDRGMVLRLARDDALAGLSAMVAELCYGSLKGTWIG
jgi:putative stress-induced transcription regulator